MKKVERSRASFFVDFKKKNSKCHAPSFGFFKKSIDVKKPAGQSKELTLRKESVVSNNGQRKYGKYGTHSTPFIFSSIRLISNRYKRQELLQNANAHQIVSERILNLFKSDIHVSPPLTVVVFAKKSVVRSGKERELGQDTTRVVDVSEKKRV